MELIQIIRRIPKSQTSALLLPVWLINAYILLIVIDKDSLPILYRIDSIKNLKQPLDLLRHSELLFCSLQGEQNSLRPSESFRIASSL